jgi:hypothetical protein
MAHLYFKAKESFAAQSPPEVRILKRLLAVESVGERLELLEQAFSPGARLLNGFFYGRQARFERKLE